MIENLIINVGGIVLVVWIMAEVLKILCDNVVD
jgi:hypothetical protein